VPSLQPQEPVLSKAEPNPNCSRLGLEPGPYKDCSHEQVGQWAIEEADKIEKMAIEHMPNDAKMIRPQDGFFSNDFKACCAQDVKDLRAEILRRLGPPAKNPEEEEHWNMVFREQMLPPGSPIFPHFTNIEPFSVKLYAPISGG